VVNSWFMGSWVHDGRETRELHIECSVITFKYVCPSVCVSLGEGCVGDQQTLIAASANVSCEKKEIVRLNWNMGSWE
jgi:hypothetical protein